MASSLSSVIGALRVNLELASANFKKGLDGAKGDLSKFKASVDKMAPAIAAAAAVAATAAAAGIAVATSRVAANAKEISNVTKTLGVSTESFQVMSGAAQKFGIEQDKLKDILKDSGEKLAEYYATGGGGYKDFMEQIAKPAGVNIEDLIKLPPEEQLRTVVKLMDDAGLSMQQQAFYLEAIASDATYLIPVLSNGGAELDKMRAHMQATGQILSTSVIANLTKAKDNMQGVGGIMAGWANILVSSFAPELQELTTKLFTLLANNEAIRTAFADAGAAIGGFLSTITQNLAPMVSAFTYVISHTREIIALGAAAAIVWGASMVGAMLAAATATGVLTASMVALKFAIASTGIGLIVVAIAALIVKIWEWSDSVGGVGNAFAIVSDVAQGVWDNIGNGASYIGNSLASIAFGIAANFTSAFAQVKSAFADLMVMIEGGINKMITGLNEALTFEGPFGISSKVDIDAVSFAEGYQKAADAAAASAANLEAKSKAAADAAAKAKESIVDTTDIVTRSVNVYGNTAANGTRDAKGEDQGAKPVTTTAPTFNSGVGAGGGGGGADAANKEADALKKLEESVISLRETKGMSALQEAIYNEQKKIGTAASKEYVAQLVTEKYQIEQQAEAVKSAAQNMKQALTDTFGAIVTGAESGRDAISALLKQMAETMASNAFMMFFNSFGNMGAGGGGWFGQLVTSAFGKVGANANGTDGWRGGLTMVGERGPELINLRSGAQVYSNRETQRLMSGGNGGGNTKIQVDLSPDLEARVIEQANKNAVAISKGQINQFNKKVLPGSVKNYTRDPKKR